MPTPTYDLITSNTLVSSTSSVTFSSIPGTYRDLILVADFLGTSTTNSLVTFRFNSDSSSTYLSVVAKGSSGLTSSSTTADVDIPLSGSVSAMGSAGRFLSIINIMDYSTTDRHKLALVRSNRADINFVGMTTGRWPSTSAINTITFQKQGTSDFAAGTRFYLYGVVS